MLLPLFYSLVPNLSAQNIVVKFFSTVDSAPIPNVVLLQNDDIIDISDSTGTVIIQKSQVKFDLFCKRLDYQSLNIPKEHLQEKMAIYLEPNEKTVEGISVETSVKAKKLLKNMKKYAIKNYLLNRDTTLYYKVTWSMEVPDSVWKEELSAVIEANFSKFYEKAYYSGKNTTFCELSTHENKAIDSLIYENLGILNITHQFNNDIFKNNNFNWKLYFPTAKVLLDNSAEDSLIFELVSKHENVNTIGRVFFYNSQLKNFNLVSQGSKFFKRQREYIQITYSDNALVFAEQYDYVSFVTSKDGVNVVQKIKMEVIPKPDKSCAGKRIWDFSSAKTNFFRYKNWAK